MANELTTAVEANKLLDFCATQMDVKWQDSLVKMFPSYSDYSIALHNLVLCTKRAKVLAPRGVVTLNRNQAIAGSGINRKYASSAYKLLKTNNRLLQVGAGVGKGIVVIDSTPISLDGLADELVVVEPIVVDHDSPSSLLKGLAEHIARLEDQMKKTPDTAKLEQIIKEKDEEIAALKQEIANIHKIHAITSW